MLDIEEFKKKLDKKSRLIGIDPGKKRIGIAISDEDKIVATPYKTVIKKDYSNFLAEIKKIVLENNIKDFYYYFILFKFLLTTLIIFLVVGQNDFLLDFKPLLILLKHTIDFYLMTIIFLVLSISFYNFLKKDLIFR